MDRDTRWERTKLAYDAIVHAEGLHAASAEEAIAASYERGETDEFVEPTVSATTTASPRATSRSSSTSAPTAPGEMTRALAEPELRRVLPRRRPDCST